MRSATSAMPFWFAATCPAGGARASRAAPSRGKVETLAAPPRCGAARRGGRGAAGAARILGAEVGRVVWDLPTHPPTHLVLIGHAASLTPY